VEKLRFDANTRRRGFDAEVLAAEDLDLRQ